MYSNPDPLAEPESMCTSREFQNMNPLHDQAIKNPEVAPEFREVGDRLAPESWHLDAVLPPNDGEMVYEDLQPVAAAMQGLCLFPCEHHGSGVNKKHALSPG